MIIIKIPKGLSHFYAGPEKKRKDYNPAWKKSKDQIVLSLIDICKNASPLSKLYVLEMISDQYFMFCSLIFLVFSILLVARAPTCFSYSSWLISLMTVCFNSKVKQGWLIYKDHQITLLFFYALHNQLKGSILKSNEHSSPGWSVQLDMYKNPNKIHVPSFCARSMKCVYNSQVSMED